METTMNLGSIPVEERADWKNYFDSERSDSARNKLIVRYLGNVGRVAKKISSEVASHVRLGDLVSDGTLGLMDGIGKYNPQIGSTPSVYLNIRIRGNIIDEVRRRDWVPRKIRVAEKNMERVIATLNSKLEREPTPEEIMQEMQLSPAEFEKVKRKADSLKTYSIDDYANPPESAGSLGLFSGTRKYRNIIENQKAKMPSAQIDAADFFWNGQRDLTIQERIVLHEFYVAGMEQQQIAKAMEVTPSRVSQVHTSAITKLRATLEQSYTPD